MIILKALSTNVSTKSSNILLGWGTSEKKKSFYKNHNVILDDTYRMKND